MQFRKSFSVFIESKHYVCEGIRIKECMMTTQTEGNRVSTAWKTVTDCTVAAGTITL
jgi:hypothetical protein